MDKLKDFFREIKDRASNPLLSSFALSWLVINWKIPIGLFFYSGSDLAKDGYTSYFDLISKNSKLFNTFCLPFLLAILYTAASPVMRHYINLFYAKIQKWSSDKILSVSGEGKISVTRYIQLRKLYEEKKATVQEVLENEASFLEDIKTLKEKIEVSEKNNRKLEVEHESITNFNDWSNSLNGDWLLKFSNENDFHKVEIRSSRIYEYDDKALNKTKLLFNIDELAYNNHSKRLILILSDENRSYSFTQVFNVNKKFILFTNTSYGSKIRELRKVDTF